VLALLSHDTITASGSVCEVHEKKCMGCGECVSACAYGAIELRETRQGKKAVVNPVLCKGDGLCNAKCPTGAIQLKHFTDEELLAQIDAASEVCS
jgi:heterodisulfide reductase subunit A